MIIHSSGNKLCFPESLYLNSVRDVLQMRPNFAYLDVANDAMMNTTFTNDHNLGTCNIKTRFTEELINLSSFIIFQSFINISLFPYCFYLSHPAAYVFKTPAIFVHKYVVTLTRFFTITVFYSVST